MHTATMNEIIRTLLPTAYTVNTSSWGEPLLTPHLDTLLDACRRFEVFLSVTTNGTLLGRPRLLEKLIPVLHRLEISFDSARREVFNELRAGARLEQVLGNARTVGKIRRSLPDPKFSLGFSMTLYRENLEEVPEVLRLVADCGGNFLRTDIGVIFDKKDVDRSILSCPGVYNDVFTRAQRCASELGVRLFMRPPFADSGDGRVSREGRTTNEEGCEYLYTHACISSNGSFKPCFLTVISGQSDRARQGVVARRWNGEQMRALRREHRTDRAHHLCKTCYLTRRGRDGESERKDQFLRGEAAR